MTSPQSNPPTESGKSSVVVLNPAQKLAIAIHDKIWSFNYELSSVWKDGVSRSSSYWDNKEHQEYLLQAEKILSLCHGDLQQALSIIDVINEVDFSPVD